MQQNTICPECDGSGKVPLTEVLTATLGAVSALGGSATAPQLFEIDDWGGVSVTALNNRLEDLRRFGFLDRKHTKGGKGWTYTLRTKQVGQRNKARTK